MLVVFAIVFFSGIYRLVAGAQDVPETRWTRFIKQFYGWGMGYDFMDSPEEWAKNDAYWAKIAADNRAARKTTGSSQHLD